MDIILNQNTKVKISSMENELPHAILLTGEKGVGLATIAKHLADSDLASFVEPMNSKEEIDHETGTISVATIRRLYERSRTKTTSRHVFILDDADRMSLGAQAAFLKLLEEPTEHTHFILTSHTPQALLPTVRSRVQALVIEPVSRTQTDSLLKTHGISDSKTKAQLEYLASGLPAELTRLIQGDVYFQERAEVMADTRTFLSGSAYDKLLIVNKYHKDRSKALGLIDSALMVTKRSLGMKPQPGLVSQLDALLSVREKIEANCSIRLQLTSFVLQ